VEGRIIEQDRRSKARDSIRVNRELDSNEIDESDRHDEKHDESRISISFGIITFDDLEK
jgi:hypothetical protein